MKKRRNYYLTKIEEKKSIHIKITFSSVIKLLLYIFIVKKTFSKKFKSKNIIPKTAEKKILNKTSNYDHNYTNYTIKLLKQKRIIFSKKSY